MNIKEITDLLLSLQNFTQAQQPASNVGASKNIGKYVICRSHDSGVHVGLLRNVWPVTGGLYEIELDECRRIWGWESDESGKRWTITELLQMGPTKGCKLSAPMDGFCATGFCEVLPITDADAILRFKSVIWL